MFSFFYNQQSYSTTGVVKTEVKTKTGIIVNKKEIIEEVATTYDLTVAKSERIVGTILDSIVEAVTDGKAARLSGFGKFDSFMSKPRKGRNPTTGEMIDIPSKLRIRFKAYDGFKKSSS
jgi:nucleoid DNA-binding protein